MLLTTFYGNQKQALFVSSSQPLTHPPGHFQSRKIHAFQERLLNGARELPYNMPPGMASAVGRAPLPPTTSYKTQGW